MARKETGGQREGLETVDVGGMGTCMLLLFFPKAASLIVV